MEAERSERLVVDQPSHLRYEGLPVVISQRIGILPSLYLAFALCFVHTAAALLAWFTPLPVWGRVVLTVAIVVSLMYFLANDAALRTKAAIVALEVRENGGISVQTRDGEWSQCELLNSTYVSSFLTIVSLRSTSGRRSRRVILVRDNVDPGDFRRLRAWLRWKDGRTSITEFAADC